MGLTTAKQISVTVIPELSPRIETWLAGKDIYYEVEVVKQKKGGVRLKIIASFSSDERGNHFAELYKRFLERIENHKGGK